MPAKKRKERKAPTKITTVSTTNRKQRRVEAKVTEKYETEKEEEEIVREGEKEERKEDVQQKKKKEKEKELTPPREVDVEHEGENTTVREILRLPRYFDDDFEAAAMRCFRCGKGGHREFECTLPPKQKPCHLCGDFDHQARDCPKGLCFNCLTPGHRSRDCQERRGIGREQQSLCCLRCGRSGHVVEKCTFTFSEADLKQMQCYVCGEFGHLCCAPQDSQPPGKLSCVKCGGEGHVESTCRNSNFRRSPGVFECFNCGGPHLARECPNSRLSGGVGSRYSSSHLGIKGGGGWGGMGSNGNNRNNSMSRMGSVGGTYTNGGGGGNFSAGRVGGRFTSNVLPRFQGHISDSAPPPLGRHRKFDQNI